MSEKNPKEHNRNQLGFFAVGFFKQFVTILVIIATSDILADTYIPTITGIVAHLTPYYLATTLLPRVICQIPPSVRFLSASLLSVCGLVIYSFAWFGTKIRLVGAGVAGIGVGITEVSSLLWFQGHHDRIKVARSFELGGRISSLVGVCLFTGLTTLACLSPQTALLSCAPLPILVIPVYFLLDKPNLKTGTQAPSHTDVQYELIKSNVDDAIAGVSWRENISAAWNNRHLVFSIFIAFFARFLTANAVATTLCLPQSNLSPRNHFVFYTLSGVTGEMIGKSYKELCFVGASVRSCISSKAPVIAILLVACTLLPLFGSWYRFIPSVFVVIVLMFFLGSLSGVVFVSGFSSLDEIEDSRSKDITHYVLTVALGTAIIAAGFIGLFVEPRLVHHCLDLGLAVDNCLTRPMSSSNSSSCFLF